MLRHTGREVLWPFIVMQSVLLRGTLTLKSHVKHCLVNGMTAVSMDKFWYDSLRGGWDFGGQARRDQAGRDALHLAKGGERDLPYCLYLRPFESVNRMTIQAPFSPDSTAKVTDFEEILLKAVEGLYQGPRRLWGLSLVALGEHDALIFGAGLAYSSEAEWREAFSALTEAVRLIVIVPSARPGTLWELSQLAHHRRWHKTLLVMPETFYVKEIMIEQRWAEAIEASRGVGITLPAYQKRGMLFRLDENGKLLGSRPLWLSHRLFRVGYLRRAISALFALDMEGYSRGTSAG